MNSLVVKHNDLVNAKYNLNLSEQKVLLYAVSRIDTSKEQFNIIEFDIKEFTELLGKEETKSKRYDEIRKIVRSLRAKEIILIDDKGEEFYAGWLANVKIAPKTGKIRLKFDDDLIPYLLRLKERFTRYELKNVIYLESKYSIRLYEMMKQVEYRKHRQFTINEFKDILQLGDMYSRFYDLEKRVIIPAIEEINEQKETDIIIDYEVIRKGRKIDGLLFKVEPKDQDQKVYIEYLNEFYNIQDMKIKMGLSNENFNSKQIMSIYELAVEKVQDRFDVFEYVRLNYIHVKAKGSARNIYSYLLSAIENDYGAAVGQLILFDMV